MKKKSILLVLVTLLILYISNSKLITKSIINYTNLFLTKLFPSSLIFLTFSNLLLDYGIINAIQKKHLNGTKTYVILMSLISGFPSGPKYTIDLYNKGLITKNIANKYLLFTHFPNPLFILGTVSLILKDNYLTITLLISIILSNLIIFLFNPDQTKISNSNQTTNEDFSTNLTNSLKKSIKLIILIYGISLFFYLISVIINKYIIINTRSFVLINGLFDLTNGIASTILITNKLERALLVLIFISFGSLSIHMQIKSILKDTLSYNNFLKGRVIGTTLSIIIFIFFYIIRN